MHGRELSHDGTCTLGLVMPSLPDCVRHAMSKIWCNGTKCFWGVFYTNSRDGTSFSPYEVGATGGPEPVATTCPFVREPRSCARGAPDGSPFA